MIVMGERNRNRMDKGRETRFGRTRAYRVAHIDFYILREDCQTRAAEDAQPMDFSKVNCQIHAQNKLIPEGETLRLGVVAIVQGTEAFTLDGYRKKHQELVGSQRCHA